MLPSIPSVFSPSLFNKKKNRKRGEEGREKVKEIIDICDIIDRCLILQYKIFLIIDGISTDLRRRKYILITTI